MIIKSKNLRLKYRDRENRITTSIKDDSLVFNLQEGQEIYCITYGGNAINEYLKYDVKIKKISKEGILLEDWEGEEFYPWERKYKNFMGEVEVVHLLIEPCGELYEKPNDIKKLLDGEVEHDKGIWYRHGGFRISSKYEKNLKDFKILGQQSMF